jgi:hypothetical protein
VRSAVWDDAHMQQVATPYAVGPRHPHRTSTRAHRAVGADGQPEIDLFERGRLGEKLGEVRVTPAGRLLGPPTRGMSAEPGRAGSLHRL